ncbi:hypothetical protein D187_010298 [Cystobacter fuscus DSM 2262]|uniref:Calx-beta domain-containing protein n=1 Tax=Cystobacter fuscus (strain ATCC 25194 / DSM 2262 / NBRC 100088 / M29) TaxID=1242864 RepID=S9QK95_CYSF2|nr:heparinase II/III family protein [Cystobacter fuscus]EPX61679.1 hypothetical protein D187_010298 [Cystobacter fuscus DSM 2262]
MAKYSWLSNLAAVSVFAFGVTARAGVVLNEPFTDGSRSNTSGGDTQGGVWYYDSTTPELSVVNDAGGLGSGNALRLAPTSGFHKLLTFFSPQTLAVAGDTITVTFDYRFPVAPGSSGGGLRVGLLSSGGTRQTADGGSRSDDKNYGFSTNAGGNSGTGTGVAYEGAGDDVLGGSGAGARIGFGTAGDSVASGTKKHSAFLQVTRLTTGALLVQARLDNLGLASGVHAAPVLTYVFDGFALGFGGTDYYPTLLLDNVVVTTSRQNLLDITATQANASEVGLSPGVLTVTRTDTSTASSVPYTVSGTATGGGDYQPLSGTVSFAAGVGSATLTVTPLEDWIAEGNETVNVTLGQVPGAILQTRSATVTLADNTAVTLPSDALFFSKLDLGRPGLDAVRTAVRAGNYTAARASLAAYFRARTTPIFPLSNLTPNTTQINDALAHRYTVVGTTYDFEPEPVTAINWSYNPTSPVNNEWPWQLNRHAWWDDLAQAYKNNPSANEAYLKELLFELKDWITHSPAPATSSNGQAGSRWRTIEVGIRLGGVWPSAFFRVLNAPALTDELLILWLKSFYMQARHLQAYTAGAGNWVAIEQHGLFTMGTIFPEFSEAETWRTLAISRVETMLTNDVFPDGAEVELTPGYHNGVIADVEGIKSLAVLNSVPTSPVFDARLEGMYAYLMWLSEPNRGVPVLNDSWPLTVTGRLANGYASFPARTDFRWMATNGTAGVMPAHTSHLFTNAGQAVMRSGWGPSDSWALLEAGPYGSGHQNEDKLGLSVDGYGQRHILDTGTYDYDASPYRAYSLSSFAQSQPIIDGLNQNRAAQNATEDRIAAPVVWRTSALYDYAAGSYGAEAPEGWGPNRLKPAVTTRHVFFVKPDGWVVIDDFRVLDGGAHTYTGLFHLNDDTAVVDAATQRLTVQINAGEVDPFTRAVSTTTRPSLTITPLRNSGQTLSVVKGQETPTISGWRFEKDTTWKKWPIPTARFDLTTTGDARMAYVLAAAPASSAPRLPTITRAATSAGTYGVTVSFGTPGDERTFLVGLNGARPSWNGVTFASPAAIISSSGAYTW